MLRVYLLLASHWKTIFHTTSKPLTIGARESEAWNLRIQSIEHSSLIHKRSCVHKSTHFVQNNWEKCQQIYFWDKLFSKHFSFTCSFLSNTAWLCATNALWQILPVTNYSQEEGLHGMLLLMAILKQIKLILSWKTTPSTALLTGPSEAHAPCQQTEMQGAVPRAETRGQEGADSPCTKAWGMRTAN